MILIALCQNYFVINCSELVILVDCASCTYVNTFTILLLDLQLRLCILRILQVFLVRFVLQYVLYSVVKAVLVN